MADEIKDITKVTEKEGIAVTGVASVFTEKERSALAAYMGVTLSDDVDYSFDELDRLHDDIMERFPYEFDPVTADNGAQHPNRSPSVALSTSARDTARLLPE